MAQSPSKLEKTAEPTWEIAQLFPAQGHWSEEEYLALDTNHLIEFSDGYLEFLPLPTQSHQLLLIALFEQLDNVVRTRQLGIVLFAPMRIQLWRGKFRERDIVYMAPQHAGRRGEEFWRGADLVMEVASPDDPDRDLVTKRHEYAQAGIPEYWIVDPIQMSITVLTLDGQSYALHGEFDEDAEATSRLLDGFTVSVRDMFAEIS